MSNNMTEGGEVGEEGRVREGESLLRLMDESKKHNQFLRTSEVHSVS